MVHQLVQFNRSYRRFDESKILEMDFLEKLVELGRLSPSPRNLQALKFYISNHPDENNNIFQTLAWAGYLTDWDGPEIGERPSAYIIILADKHISNNFNKDLIYTASGIVSQSILIGAAEHEIGGCMIDNIQKLKLQQMLQLEANLEIILVLALGVPKEKIIIETLDTTGSVRYWRDNEQVHHVPKRKLADIILKKS